MLFMLFMLWCRLGDYEVTSTCGYVFTLVGEAVSWKSSKETCIARSTMESEFISYVFAYALIQSKNVFLKHIVICGGLLEIWLYGK